MPHGVSAGDPEIIRSEIDRQFNGFGCLRAPEMPQDPLAPAATFGDGGAG